MPDSTFILAAGAFAFVLAGFVKGVLGQGLPTVILVLSKNGFRVTADAGGSFASPNSTITSYTFIWNDGSTNDVTASSIMTHLYPGPVFPATTESFTVTVRATDSLGRVGSTAQTITLP